MPSAALPVVAPFFGPPVFRLTDQPGLSMTGWDSIETADSGTVSVSLDYRLTADGVTTELHRLVQTTDRSLLTEPVPSIEMLVCLHLDAAVAASSGAILLPRTSLSDIVREPGPRVMVGTIGRGTIFAAGHGFVAFGAIDKSYLMSVAMPAELVKAIDISFVS